MLAIGQRRLRAAALAALLPGVLAVGLVGALYGPLLDPSVALATRDFAGFHLPLRVDLARLAAGGLPAWNPYLYGGQPLLSNPSYAAFYPPTWIAFALPPAYALSVSVVLHALIGLAGAWVLARRLGCGREAAALAAAGFAGGGATVSLLHASNLFTGIVWLPWVLAWGDAALGAPPGRWLRPALAAGGALGLAMLNGEPVTVVICGLGLAAFAAARLGRPLAASVPRAARALVPPVLALALAAVQVVPTMARLADTPRGRELPASAADTWSMPPERFAELVWPRLFGDPMRGVEGLWFGWGRHDRDFPYLPSIYPGLLVAVLAAAALARWPIARRRGWLVAVVAGALLALGRHTPVYDLLAAVSPLGRLRYPEKFALLALAALPFAAALGWQRLLDERRRGRLTGADLPLALALAAAAASTALGAALTCWPRLGAGLVRAGSALPPSPAALERGVGLLRFEAWAAALTALAGAALLALVRWRRPPAAALTVLALALLGADLWRTGHDLVRRLPAAEYRRPPPLARQVQPAGGRLFSDEAFHRRGELVVHGGDPATAQTRAALHRLDPYTGNLWGIPYALHEDYDLMLTTWARHALGALRGDWQRPRAAAQLLAAWNVRWLVLRRPAEELVAAAGRGAAPEPARLLVNHRVLPRYRFVERVAVHPDPASALAAARAAEYELSRSDHWLEAGREPAELPPRAGARIAEVEEAWPRVGIAYTAPEGGYMVAALTFDRGWSAALDGEPLPLHPTAVGQIGANLPPAPRGSPRRLELVYRDRWLPPAAALSLLAWLGLAALALHLPSAVPVATEPHA